MHHEKQQLFVNIVIGGSICNTEKLFNIYHIRTKLKSTWKWRFIWKSLWKYNGSVSVSSIKLNLILVVQIFLAYFVTSYILPTFRCHCVESLSCLYNLAHICIILWVSLFSHGFTILACFSRHTHAHTQMHLSIILPLNSSLLESSCCRVDGI